MCVHIHDFGQPIFDMYSKLFKNNVSSPSNVKAGTPGSIILAQ
jgi:hypothetical protein